MSKGIIKIVGLIVIALAFISITTFFAIPVFSIPTFTGSAIQNNNSEYSPSNNYGFEIIIVDDGTGPGEITNVTFETNLTTGGSLENITIDDSSKYTAFTNDTSGAWWINFTQDKTAGAGLYHFRWYANNTTDSWNETGVMFFMIAQNSTNPVRLFLNGTEVNNTYTYPETINATATSFSGAAVLYRDGSPVSNPDEILLGVGEYAYNVISAGDQNYTANSTGVTYYALVSQGTPDVRTFIDDSSENKTVTHPTSVTIKGNSTTATTPPIFALYVGDTSLGGGASVSQSVSLGVGTFNVVYNTSGNENWTTAINNSLYLTVSQNTTNPVLMTIDNGTAYDNQNVSITYGTPITVNCSNAYSDSGSCSLYRNGTYIGNSETVTLGVGDYAYKVNTSGNANYSANATGGTFYVMVSKATPTLNLSGSNVVYPNNVTITASETNSVDADVNYTLWRNNTLVNSSNGTAPSYNALLGAGAYIFVLNTNGGTNFSSNLTNSTNVTITVTKGSPTLALLIEGSASGKSVAFGATTNTTGYETNVGDSDCNYTLYRNSESVNNSLGTISTTSNIQSLAAGTYNYIYGINETCANWTATNSTSLTLTVTISSNVGGGGIVVSTVATPYVKIGKGNANITLSSLTTSGKMMATIAKYEDVAIRGINVTVNNNVANIKLVMTRLVSLPSTVSYDVSGTVYNYISIEKTNITDSDIDTVSIMFAVNKSWLSANGISSSNITLYRWSGSAWDDLNAIMTGEDMGEVFYTTGSPGLSVFVIGTKGVQAQAPEATTCSESWSCDGWSACADGSQTRACIDSNSCGTTAAKPAESRECVIAAQIDTGQTDFSAMAFIVVVIIALAVSVFIFVKKGAVATNLQKVFKTRPKHHPSREIDLEKVKIEVE